MPISRLSLPGLPGLTDRTTIGAAPVEAAPVRRAPLGTAPVRTLTAARRPSRRLVAVLAALVLVPLIVALADGDSRPPGLAGYELVGERSPIPLDIYIPLDFSGTFSDAEDQQLRADVVQQLWAWAPRNLRPDDRITVVAFAGTAETLVDHLPVADLDALPRLQPAFLGDGTNLLPVMTELNNLVDAGRNNTLIAVTDTVVHDAEPAYVADIIRTNNIATVSTIVPSSTDVTGDWKDSFTNQHIYDVDPDDDDQADQTAIAFGRAVAHATDQRLEPIED